MSDQVISNFSKQDDMNPDSRMNINTTLRQTALEKHCFTGINSELSNSEESHSHNQEMLSNDYLENKRIRIIGENTSSNMNLSEKANTAFKCSDLGACEGNNIHSVDEAVAVCGPSRSLENISQSNLCVKSPQIRTLSKQQTTKKTGKKNSTCSACNKKISEHFKVYEGKNRYKCCQCRYKTDNCDFLVLHISNHSFKTFYCHVCNVGYSDLGLHGSKQTCNVCEKKFECKIQLEDHYLIHEKHHRKHCRICQRKIGDHLKKCEEGNLYICCRTQCKYKNKTSVSFREHLYIHSYLKLFKCNQCGSRFPQKANLNKHLRNYHG
ncbi:unnamed protein product [Larinioides sclopetarius]|uniref:C2H2-type domain-containing protein n=1 Tax=Larinioides sclopetarius TaxID=280406 RepID=A0AAV2A079_9ARAC